MTQPIFRIAPSPNGRLHLGHAYSALLNAEMARNAKGRLLLRIEDTDVTRCTPELMAHVVEDLRWLGITWEEPLRIQSQHFDDYEKALQALWAEGHIFPCFCSRKRAAEMALTSTDPDGQHHYGGLCKKLQRSEAEFQIGTGTPHGWRLKTENTTAANWGDVMIAKPKTGSWYHMAVVVDDALQGVTHVVRGKDIEAATPIHHVLQRHLNLPAPHYHHHKLLTDGAGQKLSKSLKSKSLAALREEGATPQTLRRQLGFW